MSCLWCAQKKPRFAWQTSILQATNTLDLIIQTAIGREEWIRMRNTFAVNCSSLPTICGHNYFQSVDELVLERLLEGRLGTNPQYNLGKKRVNNDAKKQMHIDRGIANEPIAADKFTALTGHNYMPISGTTIFSNPEFMDGQIAGTLDRMTWCGCPLEIKCPSQDAVPSAIKKHNDQIQGYLHIFTGAPHAWLFQYVSDSKYHIQQVDRESNWFAKTKPCIEHYLSECKKYQQMYNLGYYANPATIYELPAPASSVLHPPVVALVEHDVADAEHEEQHAVDAGVLAEQELQLTN